MSTAAMGSRRTAGKLLDHVASLQPVTQLAVVRPGAHAAEDGDPGAAELVSSQAFRLCQELPNAMLDARPERG
jgi:hypothetical protein